MSGDSSKHALGSGRKVLLVSAFPIEQYPPVVNQITLLVRAGHDVKVVTTHPPAGIDILHCGSATIDRVKVWSLGRGKNLIRSLSLALHLCRLRLGGERYRFCVAYDPESILVSWLAPASIRISHLHELVRGVTGLRLWILSYLLKGSIETWVPDEGRIVLTQRQFPGVSRFAYLPNYPLMSAVVRDKQRHRVGSGLRVVYAGAFGRRQALDTVLNSLDRWPPGASLTLIGDLKSLPGLGCDAVIERHKRDGRLVLREWVAFEDLVPVLSQYDVGLSLLRGDDEGQWTHAVGASNKRYMLMAAGLAQISDLSPGVEELMGNGRIGICVDPSSIDSVVDAIVALNEDPGRVESMGREAAIAVQAMYNYDKVFSQAWARVLHLSDRR